MGGSRNKENRRNRPFEKDEVPKMEDKLPGPLQQQTEMPKVKGQSTEPKQGDPPKEPNKEKELTETQQQQPRMPKVKGQSKEPKPEDAPKKPNMDAKSTDTTTPGIDDVPTPTVTPKQAQECPLQTNCQLINVDGSIWRYVIKCKSDSLAKTEERLLVQAFKNYFKLEWMRGQLAFINGSTFLSSTEQGSLDKQTFVATLVRRPQRLDNSFHKVFAKVENDTTIKWWSSVVGGTIREFPKDSYLALPTEKNSKGTCQSQTVYVSAQPQKLDFKSILEAGQSASGPQYTNALAGLFMPPPTPRTRLSDDSTFVHGNKWYPTPGVPIGYGLSFRRGTATEVRPADSGFVRAALPCFRLFHSGIRVSEFMETHYPNLVNDTGDSSLSLAKILRGLMIRINEKDAKTRFATITGVSANKLADTTFSRGEDESSVSVVDHFAKRATLTSHGQLCVNIGSEKRPQYIPSCMCEIVPGQIYRHVVPKEAQAKVDQLKKDSYTSSTMSNITSQPRNSTNLHRSRKLATFGALSLDLSVPSTTSAWVFSKSASAAFSAHQSSKVKVICLGVGTIADTSPEVYALMKVINNTLEKWGASATASIPNLTNLENEEECISGIRKAVESSMVNQSEEVDQPLVLTFINNDERNKSNYKRLKKIFDTDLGYHNCCINVGQLKKRTFEDQYRGIDKYAARVLHQIRAKAIPSKPGLEKTLLVGVHVATMPQHPKRASHDTSKALLVALVSKPAGGNQNFAASVVLQKCSESGNVDLEALLKDHLGRKSQFSSPDGPGSFFTRIILYRSGFIANAVKEVDSSKSRTSQRNSQSPLREIGSREGEDRIFRMESGIAGAGEHSEIDSVARGYEESSPRHVNEQFLAVPPSASSDALSTQHGLSSQSSPVTSVFSGAKQMTEPLSAQARIELNQLNEAIKSITKADKFDLTYVVVGRDTRVRLFNEQGQPLATIGGSISGEPFQQVSYVVRDGVTRTGNRDWFMQKQLRGNTTLKPLHLTTYGSTQEGYKDLDQWQEAFEASFDYPAGVSSSKMVAPVHFARLAAKRAMLYMRTEDYKSDTAPYSLVPVHEHLKDSLYYV
ncbi:MAG: Protein argonaute 10 [Candelina mexicana]|nr:MAG: Protein argonaute 10 [Candelina mexicana]